MLLITGSKWEQHKCSSQLGTGYTECGTFIQWSAIWEKSKKQGGEREGGREIEREIVNLLMHETTWIIFC